jgi:periplasmic protein TonB
MRSARKYSICKYESFLLSLVYQSCVLKPFNVNADSFNGNAFQSFQGFGSGRSQRLVVLSGVTAFHALALFALWMHAPTRQAMTDVATLMVKIIRSEPPPTPPIVIEPPKPLPVAPKPKPIERKVLPKPEPRIVAAPTMSPAAIEVPAPPLEPPAPIQVEEPPAPPPPVIARPAPPAPIVLPNFNADYLNNPPPEYPSISRRMGEEGRVVLRVFVEASGLPSRVEIKSGSGFNRLDQAARDVVTQWRFVPARQGNDKVAAWVLVPIQFTLN